MDHQKAYIELRKSTIMPIKANLKNISRYAPKATSTQLIRYMDSYSKIFYKLKILNNRVSEIVS